MDTLSFSLTHLTYGEAEQFLQKAEKIAEERSKISSVRDDEIEEWDILLYQAMARFVFYMRNV